MTKLFSPMPELEQIFKTLHLHAINKKLAERNKEAIEKKLTYPEFLALLLQDELAAREQKKFSTRFKKAQFRQNKTVENFDFGFNKKINKAQIMELCTCNFIKEKVCAVLIGSCGAGKSHVAQAIGFCAIKKNIDVLFYSQVKLMQELHSAKALNIYDKKIKALAKVPLLIVDDFGLKPLKYPEDEYFHHLIDERYENTSTMITSNLTMEEWIDSFQNKLLGIATIDRIKHGAYISILSDKNYRTVRKWKEDN